MRPPKIGAAAPAEPLAPLAPTLAPHGRQAAVLTAAGVDIAAHVLAHPGHKTPEEIADDVIDILAALTPWSALLPVVGVALDAVEAKVLKAVVHAICVAIAKSHPHAKASAAPVAAAPEAP